MSRPREAGLDPSPQARSALPLSPFVEFNDAALERRFQQHQMDVVPQRIGAAVLLFATPTVLLAWIDVVVLGICPALFLILAMRMAVVTGGLGLWWFARSRPDSLALQTATLAWTVLLLSMVSLVNATRPPDYQVHVIVDAVVVLSLYLAVPNRFVLQILPALAFSTAALVMTSWSDQPLGIGVAAIWVAHVFSNGFGYFIGGRIHRLDRESFASSLREQALRARLEALAQTDDLTGTANRRAFLERAEAELDRARRHGTPVCLAVLDLDHFKAINDTYGHSGGDRVLVAFVDAVKLTIRNHDLLGRIGGEEFALLMPQTDMAGARMVSERVRTLCWSTAVAHHGENIRWTVSIGLAEVTSGDDVHALLQRADGALYRSKRDGRDRVSLAASPEAQGKSPSPKPSSRRTA